MIILRSILFFLLITLLLSSCQSDRQEYLDRPDFFLEPGLTGRQLSEWLTVSNQYRKWSSWPDYKGIQRGQNPHGHYHKIFISPNVKKSLENQNESSSSEIVPFGIIIKENFSAEKELKSITVMLKKQNFDPENHDWFWMKHDVESGDINYGKLQSCIECHQINKNKDYIFLNIKD